MVALSTYLVLFNAVPASRASTVTTTNAAASVTVPCMLLPEVGVRLARCHVQPEMDTERVASALQVRNVFELLALDAEGQTAAYQLMQELNGTVRREDAFAYISMQDELRLQLSDTQVEVDWTRLDSIVRRVTQE